MNNSWWCAHDLTTEADDEGFGICLKCGHVVGLQANVDTIRKFLEMIKSDQNFDSKRWPNEF